MPRKGPDPDCLYDVVVIGAGLSGLAATLRLAIAGKKVCLLERHVIPGGLNSYYQIVRRKLDVGLHAMTNDSREKSTPLMRVMRQLRMRVDELELCPQFGSRVVFPDQQLVFSNDPSMLIQSVCETFPADRDAFVKMIDNLPGDDQLSMAGPFQSARENLRAQLSPELSEMLLCPAMFYGCPREDDMDWNAFVILFRAVFLEGFCRPFDGIRPVIKRLLQGIRNEGGEVFLGCGVKELIHRSGRVEEILLDSGSHCQAKQVLSSVGWPETLRWCDAPKATREAESLARISYMESFSFFPESPASLGWKDTITFHHNQPTFSYRCPEAPINATSGVICVPNNFHFGAQQMLEGQLKITCPANPDFWRNLPNEEYAERKQEAYHSMLDHALKILNTAPSFKDNIISSDAFTPKTIERYTWHHQGAIYGSALYSKDGSTPLSNLRVCGTGHGYVGIVGSMLSGVSMANLYLLP